MRRQIIFITVVLALLYLAGCTTVNSVRSGDLSVESAETSQNVLTEEPMYQELPDKKPLGSVSDSPGAQEEIPVLTENALEVSDISSKQVQKWAFIGKISKEHPNIVRVLMFHTNDMVKSLDIINENSSKYSEKYFRVLPDGTSVYISKDNELFINKKGGPAPEEIAIVNIQQDNKNEASRPEYKPEEKQSIKTPEEDANEGQKIISKDNELFIDKKGGPAPEEAVTVYKKQDNINETSRHEEKTAKEQCKYYLQPGDNFEIKFYNVPRFDANLTIRPDGMVSIPPLEEFLAAGLTPAQLDETLTQKFSSILREPVINVILKDFRGQKTYVGGQVNSPMILYLEGKTNALEAIFNAGGLTDEAELSTVMIVSKSSDNQPIARSVNLKKALHGELPETEYLLKPFDMVYVPKRKLARASQFIMEIYDFIPPGIGLNFTYELHSEDNGR